LSSRRRADASASQSRDVNNTNYRPKGGSARLCDASTLAWNVRCQSFGELRVHQYHHPISRAGMDVQYRCGPIRDAAVGETQPNWKAGYHRSEIVSAIQAQNSESTERGRRTGPKGRNYLLQSSRRPSCVAEEFGQIVVRETPEGGIVRVRDVARIELVPGLQRLRPPEWETGARYRYISLPVPTPSTPALTSGSYGPGENSGS